MFDYDFGEGNYLISVNYGPQSMALLDMMMSKGVSPVVCHVNYHLCEENDDAEQKISRFCQEKGLRLEVLDARFADQKGRDEDFSKWARKTRYDFFLEVYKKYDAAALFLPHQQDDLIESYLISQRLGVSNAKYGRSRTSTYHGMLIIRPLLSYSRADLVSYCEEHNVPFSIEATNFERNHIRSEVRREIVDKLNEVERGQILDEMNKKQNDQISFERALNGSINNHDDLKIRSIIALSWDEYANTIINFAGKKAKKKVRIGEKILKELRDMCLNSKENDSLKIKDDIYFVKEYDRIFIDNDGSNLPYSYVLEKPCAFSCPSFDLDFSNGAEDRNIHEDDYPITIRSVLPQDSFVFGGYLLPVKRTLIASGITDDLLEVWPVFLNKNGKIVYVPRYVKLFQEYHTSKLVIHPEK